MLLIVSGANTAAARHHGGDAACHREPAIVRFGWHEQSAGVIAVDSILVQAACFITGDRQVVALRYKLIRQLNGGDALRAIARTGERDQQQRVRRAEIIHRVGDQIGRRYRGDVFPRVAGKPWRNDVADKSRRTRAGQNDPQIGLAQQWRQKTVDRRAQIINIVERAKPAGWLLADLFFGPVPVVAIVVCGITQSLVV